MNMSKIFVLILLGSLFASVNACGLTKTAGDPAELSYTLYYLTHGKIYKAVLPNHDKANLIYACSEDQPGESIQFNALSPGPDGTLMFHVTHTTGLSLSPSSSAQVRLTILTYNIKTGQLTPLVAVADTFLSFPVLSSDESKVAMAGRGSFFIKNLRDNKIVYYEQFAIPNRILFPWSWSPDGKLLALSGAEIGKKQSIYFFDIEKNLLIAWGTGMQPRFSPSGQLIAYLSPGSMELIIANRDGNTLQSFKGFLFKDLNGWIGENKVLFTISAGTHAHPYVNHIGIVDLKTSKIYDIKVPTEGEINGIVVTKE